ncbi:zinc-binding dehydrogenase [Pseudoalteromonas sp. S16_S37]|uniref:zinc-binding dehydrogenase n=1 Tax=Pseudoalteromonas sp. S16_S37 TaxID=2720228 RepID=UPI00168128EF|nr:zinc-binding dehydrogenase [Pseudoalteromonas sp. S16_S37]
MNTKIPNTMQAIQLSKIGHDFCLEQAELAVPKITEQQVLVKIEYVGLGALDEKFAQIGTPCWQYPRVFGFDAVGTVVDAPIGVHPKVGTKVMWHNDISTPGVMSEYASVANYALTVLPEGIDPAKAACLPTPGMTALIALFKLQLNEGDSVFIESGHSCTGQLAIQFAKQQGLVVFTNCVAGQQDLLKSLGADAVFEQGEHDLAEQIQRKYGYDGVQGVIDCTGERTNELISLLQFCGRVSCIAGLSQLDDALLFKKAPNIGIVSLPGAWLAKSICAQQRMSFLGNMLAESLVNDSLSIHSHELIGFDADSITSALKERIHSRHGTFQSIKLAH